MRALALPHLVVDWWEAGTDRIAGSDPGLNRLLLATRGALTIALALAGEYAFVRATGALEVVVPPHATPAEVAATTVQHHDVLVVAMLLGGLVGLMTAMNVNDRTLAGQAVTLTYIPAALIAALTIGLGLGPHRGPALVVMVVLLTAGAYGRRFGPRGVPAGILMFLGYFYGFFLSATLSVSAIGWLAAEVMVAVAAAAVVRFSAFRPSPAADLRRAMRSYEALARRVTDLALAYLDEPDARRRRALHRWLVRLDEAALIVEGNVATPRALPPATAIRLRQWLFDVELALTNAARFIEALVPPTGQPERNDAVAPPLAVRRALAAVGRGDVGAARREAAEIRRVAGAGTPGPGTTDPAPPAPAGAGLGGAGDGGAGHWRPAAVGGRPSRRVVLHRYAAAIEVLAAAVSGWQQHRTAVDDAYRTGDAAPATPFEPAVALQAGRLPGTAEVSGEASTAPGARVRLAPYVRTTAQVTVAVSVAIVAGDALDAHRFYWAVVAALLALVGTNTVAEQLRKAFYRVIGTLVGVVAGTALVNAVGTHSIWSLVVVVVSLWVGMYLFRVNYAFMALAITVSLSQAYLSLGEFSGGLLAERLAETAVGAGAAMVTVLVVVPLRTRRVLDVAAADLIEAVAALADAAAERVMTGTAGTPATPEAAVGDLRAAGRRVDAAYQALVATAEPLRMVSWADAQDRVARLVRAATAARNYGRNVAFDLEGAHGEGVDPGVLARARTVMAASASALSNHLRAAAARGRRGGHGGGGGVFTRAGALLGAAECDLAAPSGQPSPTVLVLRDLALVDGTLATIARDAGMEVRTLDADLDAPPAESNGSAGCNGRAGTHGRNRGTCRG